MSRYERHSAEATSDLLSKGFRPVGEYRGSQQPWDIECLKCGFQFASTRAKIKRGDVKNCPNCREKLRSIFAQEASDVMRSAGLSPLEDYPGKNSAPWKCSCDRCGSQVSPTFANVKSGGGGCIYCGIKAVAKSKVIRSDVAIKVMNDANLKPLEPYSSARSKWKCECMKCGEVCFPTYNGIQQGEGGCSKCGRESASAKTRVEPETALKIMRSLGYEPIEAYQNSKTGWKSRCLSCKRIVYPAYSNVKKQKSVGCIYCWGGRVEENDAVRILESSGVVPLVPYPGKDEPWESRCVKCQRIVTPTYANARRGQGGCKFCAEHGIDLVAPAYLYFLFHPVFNAYKVGIGKSGAIKQNDRIGNLRRKGWELQKKFEYETGLQAQTHESHFFQIIRDDMKIPVYLSAEEMKQTAGHTETFSADSISATKVLEILQSIRKMPLP